MDIFMKNLPEWFTSGRRCGEASGDTCPMTRQCDVSPVVSDEDGRRPHKEIRATQLLGENGRSRSCGSIRQLLLRHTNSNPTALSCKYYYMLLNY